MKHFDYVEWLLYKNNLISGEKEIEMMDHLYQCDSCMELFLSLIDEKEVEEASNRVPENFKENIIQEIKKLSEEEKAKKKPMAFNDFLLYYAAVASVAIVLTGGGIFGRMVDWVPKISSSISMEENQIKAESIYSFSERITNKTSAFVNDFNLKKVKEE